MRFTSRTLMSRHAWGQYALELHETASTFSSCAPSRLVGYRLFMGDELIFEGTDFEPSILHGVDDAYAAAALLEFLRVSPDDMAIDTAYFDGYTEEQLAFVRGHGNDLWFWSQVLKTTGDKYIEQQYDEFCTEKLVLPDDFELEG